MQQHIDVFHALKNGILVKPIGCSFCGKDVFLEGHHTDYTKALDVVWLCKDCHAAVHKNSNNPPGRKRKSKSKKASEVIVVYLTSEQKKVVQSYCNKINISFSMLVKQLLSERGIL